MSGGFRRQRAPRGFTLIRRAPRGFTLIRRASRGFTLIEMLVVLVILGLVVGLVVARGPQRSPGFALRSEAQLVSRALGQARGEAIATGDDVAVGVVADPPGLAAGGRRLLRLPAGISLVVLDGDGRPATATDRFRFHPDGSADGGGVLVANAAGRIAVHVSWLTGRISVADAH